MSDSVQIRGVSSTVDTLTDYAKDLGLDLLGEIIRLGRMMAVECARMTQPWGLDAKAQLKGKGAVAKDIQKVFGSPSRFYRIIRRKHPEAAESFWMAYKEGDEARMRENMIIAGAATAISDRPDRALHEAARKGERKHVNSAPKQMVTNPATMEKYIKQRQQAVGFVKAGWARAADDCGGHRGIPAWASTKQPGATGRAIIERHPIKPKVTIENTIPYVMENLTTLEINGALNDAYGKILKYLSYRKKQPLTK